VTKREMNLRIFQGKPVPHVFFQPRIEPWFELNQRRGTLPREFVGLDVRGLYDSLDISMRYSQYFTGQPDPVQRTFSPAVKLRSESTSSGIVNVIETPYGDLVTRYQFAGDAGCRIVDFPVQGPDDLRKMRWVYENTRYSYSPENFQLGSDFFGDRGQPQFWVPRSPYQALALDWMKFETFVMALMDSPQQFEPVMQAIDDSYDDLFEQLANANGPTIINFGENVDCQLLSPRFFEKYHLAYYHKRSTPLRQAGIFTHVHLDGSLKTLLPFLEDLPFDGLEALTPRPMGDVTLEELSEHMGGKVLLDGIPAVLFLPPFTLEDVQACVERIVELFAPRLVLGISDELPMAADEEGIRRLKWVVEYCRKTAAPVISS